MRSCLQLLLVYCDIDLSVRKRWFSRPLFPWHCLTRDSVLSSDPRHQAGWTDSVPLECRKLVATSYSPRKYPVLKKLKCVWRTTAPRSQLMILTFRSPSGSATRISWARTVWSGLDHCWRRVTIWTPMSMLVRGTATGSASDSRCTIECL